MSKKLTISHRKNISIALKGYVKTLAHRANISKAKKGVPNPEASRVLTGRKLSLAHCKAISEGHKGSVIPLVTRIKMSLAKRGKVKLFPRLHSKFKTGVFFSAKNQAYLYYRSSYELVAFKKLEVNDCVARYESEAVQIKYEFEGRQRTYIPDIKVYYTDGSWDLAEVKPKDLVNTLMNQAKFAAADDFCSQRGAFFNVWSESYLGLLVQNKEVENVIRTA